jgi:hypothetical protein
VSAAAPGQKLFFTKGICGAKFFYEFRVAKKGKFVGSNLALKRYSIKRRAAAGALGARRSRSDAG